MDIALSASRPSGTSPPTVTDTSPTTIQRFLNAQTLTINGAHFVDGCIAYCGVTALTTVFVSAAQVTATVPASSLYENASFAVTVVNPNLQSSGSSSVVVTQPATLQWEYRNRADCVAVATGVSTYTDQSLVGDRNRDLVQATGSAQPAWSASDASYNGKPTATMASAKFMRSGTWTTPLAQPFRDFFVGHATTAGSVAIFIEGASTTHRHGFTKAATTNALTMSGGAAPALTGASWDGLSKAVIALEWNGATSKYAHNAKTFELTVNAGTHTITRLSLGTNSSGAANWPGGTFAHWIGVDSGTMTAAEMNNIMDYLGAEYGVSISA